MMKQTEHDEAAGSASDPESGPDSPFFSPESGNPPPQVRRVVRYVVMTVALFTGGNVALALAAEPLSIFATKETFVTVSASVSTALCALGVYQSSMLVECGTFRSWQELYLWRYGPMQAVVVTLSVITLSLATQVPNWAEKWYDVVLGMLPFLVARGSSIFIEIFGFY